MISRTLRRRRDHKSFLLSFSASDWTRSRRHVGLALSVRPRHVERRVLSRPPAARLRRTRVLRRALRHGRGEFVLLPHAGPGHEPAWVRQDARVLSCSRSSSTRSSRTRTCTSRVTTSATAISRGRTVDLFRRASIRSRSRGGWRLVLVQFPPSFHADGRYAGLSRVAADGARGLYRRPWNCAIDPGATIRRHTRSASTPTRRRGC